MSLPGYTSVFSFPAQNFSESSVHTFVAAVLPHLVGGVWILLRGDLGAGKTSFVKNLVKTLAGVDDVTSPTFPVLNVIDLPRCSVKGVKFFVHLDLYRLKSARELNYLGVENQVDDACVVLVEWPEIVDDDEWTEFFEITRCQMPVKILDVKISHVPDETSKRLYALTVWDPVD
jgi:tRNA threonylcarbamoyladenosine biosynthesis protein TsaE